MRCLLVLAVLVASAASAQTGGVLVRALGTGDRADAARAFYAERGGRRVWTDSAGLSPQGRQLVAAIGAAGDDGLDPASILTPLPSAPLAREAALTHAFLRFCDQLMRGRVPPRSVHRDWRAVQRRLDVQAALRLAARRGPEAALRAARPPHAGYARLRRALVALRARASEPWAPLDAVTLQAGDEGEAVAGLRRRLRALGDTTVGDGPTVDPLLDAAVRRAQARLGLAVDGVVGPATRAALNETPTEQADRLALNLERWRWLPATLGTRHVWVDVAGMTAALVDSAQTTWRGRVIVGTARTPTPGFTSEITHVVVSPYWNVPESIARAEIRPRIARDAGYLARVGMERLAGGALRQRPGPANPLGPVKFIFDTPFGVRLHGTSQPRLFEARVRTFSHGCIRTERPLVLAERLLPSWDRPSLDAAVAARSEVWVELDAPVPIHVTYWTAWVDGEGQLWRRPDVYGRDRDLARTLGSR